MSHAAVQNHRRTPADIIHYFAKLSIKTLEENRLVTVQQTVIYLYTPTMHMH